MTKFFLLQKIFLAFNLLTIESFRVGVPSILFFLISDSLGGFNTCLNGQIERQIDREHHQGTDNGHPERAFFKKLKLLCLGRQFGLKFWERVAGSFSYKKHWFLGLKHTSPK